MPEPEFADQSEPLTGGHVEAGAVHGAHDAVIGVIVDDEIPYLKPLARHVLRLRRGLASSSSPVVTR